ncbi:MAG: sugar phosphate isomerase/epimerase [Chloroflexi bacterium]|nr:sugar phosphate isomerase/epimerase [Chloroflexota bacterium]
MDVYVSTGCLKDGKDVIRVLDGYRSASFRYIELGASHEYSADIVGCLEKQPARFLVHHYFPPPPNAFVLNLASASPEILYRSLQQIDRSLDLCRKLGSPLLSVHAGFTADPSPGLTFVGHEPQPYEKAFDIFVDSIKRIDASAREYGVRLAIENNVLAKYNMVNGTNPYLLLCRAEEFEEFFRRVPSDNVGILLDLGHLQVSSHNLGFNKDGFIDKLEDKVFALHIHDNNGEKDEHLGLRPGSWVCRVLKTRSFAALPWILESANLTIAEIRQNLELLDGQRSQMTPLGNCSQMNRPI